MNALHLPEPIAAYFDADRLDGEAVARCFTKNAVVRDEGQEHVGVTAIKAWKTAASAKYTYTCEPFALQRKGDQHIVTARLTGNFAGSSVDLRFAFRVERGRIARLEIAP